MTELGEVLDKVIRHMDIGRFVGMGAGAGACAFVQYALRERRRQRSARVKPGGSLQGLILVGMDAKGADTGEFMVCDMLYHAVRHNVFNATGLDTLAGRLFSSNALGTNSPIVASYLETVATLELSNLALYLRSYACRNSLTDRDFARFALLAGVWRFSGW